MWMEFVNVTPHWVMWWAMAACPSASQGGSLLIASRDACSAPSTSKTAINVVIRVYANYATIMPSYQMAYVWHHVLPAPSRKRVQITHLRSHIAIHALPTVLHVLMKLCVSIANMAYTLTRGPAWQIVHWGVRLSKINALLWIPVLRNVPPALAINVLSVS